MALANQTAEQILRTVNLLSTKPSSYVVVEDNKIYVTVPLPDYHLPGKNLFNRLENGQNSVKIDLRVLQISGWYNLRSWHRRKFLASCCGFESIKENCKIVQNPTPFDIFLGKWVTWFPRSRSRSYQRQVCETVRRRMGRFEWCVIRYFPRHFRKTSKFDDSSRWCIDTHVDQDRSRGQKLGIWNFWCSRLRSILRQCRSSFRLEFTLSKNFSIDQKWPWIDFETTPYGLKIKKKSKWLLEKTQKSRYNAAW